MGAHPAYVLQTASVISNALLNTQQYLSHFLESGPCTFHFTTPVIKLFYFLYSEPALVGNVVDRLINAMEAELDHRLLIPWRKWDWRGSAIRLRAQATAKRLSLPSHFKESTHIDLAFFAARGSLSPSSLALRLPHGGRG
jgi:hypothetical protein